ncbi:hypothetical protein AnigIFM63309_006166 [Aspergillus niger]|nr:hypothetical protein AnigIFM63309_006166 [Aspergillus niger]
MAGNHHPQAPTPTPLPENDQSHLCGYYFDQRNESSVVHVPSAQDDFWFQSQPLSGSLLKRLNSIQLITSSYDDHDNVSDVSGTNRSWFELSIFRENAEAQNGHRWMSHENKFGTNALQYHKGRVFTRHSEILKLLKDGDRIRVHAAAVQSDSNNYRQNGILIYGICCKGHEQPPQDSVLRGMLRMDERDPNAHSTFEYLSDKTTDQVEDEIKGDGENPIVARMKWEDTNKFATLATEAKVKRKNVLLLLDAEDLPESTNIDRRLSWGQTVENIWKCKMKELCNAIWQAPENNYFHFLVQLGLEGAIYKGFQENATQAHLIYEPTSAKGGFLRSYSDKDMENLNVESDTDMKILETGGIKVKELMEDLMKQPMTNEQREQKKTQLRKELRKQLRKDLGAVWLEGLKSSLEEESAESIRSLGITQIRDAIMTGIRWSRRCAPMMFPKGNAKQSQPVDNRLNLETDSEPVLVSVELDLANAETTSRVPLVLKSLPCSPQKAAQDTLIQGFECVLPYMPSARFGNLITADRGEVDGFRKIANRVHEWYLSNDESKPLSIAVFGQPGSGKSFGVKEVIKSILAADGKGITDLEFNLSQFREETDLRHAFEVIRGKALTKEVPIVFFDEFDSTFQGRELGWLPHFTKPITEGKYEDGEVERPLGRGIYIFIGGTQTKYDDFFSRLSGNNVPPSPREAINFEPSINALRRDVETINQGDPRGPPLKCMECDISKMSQYNQLKEKFYEIRDEALTRNMPLVFFKNFDSDFGSEKLGWLKYFLAPMQDGEFFDHGSRHPIGRAIFVFEQGTHHFNGFPRETSMLRSPEYSGAKLPDFVSRLRGYIGNGSEDNTLTNVLTWYLKKDKSNKPLSIGSFRTCQSLPDPGHVAMKTFQDTLKGYVDILGPSQLGVQDMNYFPIRRAILLRSMLERIFGFAKGKPIEMDTSVRNALLFTPTVLHGARSLESILSMSKINAGNPIKVNDICKEDQRKLHVDDETFKQYLDDEINPPNAEHNEQHYAWIERKSGRAYKPRPVVQSAPTTTPAVSSSASG